MVPGRSSTTTPRPFVTIRIYLDNLDSAFWLSQGIGNLLLLLPLGLFGPIALPWLDRWWRVLLVALALSAASRRRSSGSRNAPPTSTT